MNQRHVEHRRKPRYWLDTAGNIIHNLFVSTHTSMPVSRIAVVYIKGHDCVYIHNIIAITWVLLIWHHENDSSDFFWLPGNSLLPGATWGRWIVKMHWLLSRDMGFVVDVCWTVPVLESPHYDWFQKELWLFNSILGTNFYLLANNGLCFRILL